MRHRTNQQRHQHPVRRTASVDDADVAAGQTAESFLAIPNTMDTNHLRKDIATTGSETELLLLSSSRSLGLSDDDLSSDDSDAFDHDVQDLSKQHPPSHQQHSQSHKMQVLGIDISHLTPRAQFISCATGVFTFSLFYGFLQELLSVTLCTRQLGLFLAMLQFIGYTLWSYFFRNLVRSRRHKQPQTNSRKTNAVPLRLYLALSLLRAVDLAMTNMAMAYINYPAKTLMKSSRVVFTMLFGTFISRRTYKVIDYVVVLLMVSGLAIFMHADANSSAVFAPLGIVMLTISLLCDGAISNMSESIMKQYEVGQDEFIFMLYSIATVAISIAAAFRGDLMQGIQFLSVPGTVGEIQAGEVGTWSVATKIIVIIMFSTMGFLGSSCSAAITKTFGALTMSITSTARKATTLFFSFAYFGNVCTWEHVGGIAIFIVSLVVKSFRASKSHHSHSHSNGTSGPSGNARSSTTKHNYAGILRNRQRDVVNIV